MIDAYTIDQLLDQVDDLTGEDHQRACNLIKMYRAADEDHQQTVFFECVPEAEEMLIAWGYDEVLEEVEESDLDALDDD